CPRESADRSAARGTGERFRRAIWTGCRDCTWRSALMPIRSSGDFERKKLAPAQLRTLGPPRYATRGKRPVARRDGEKGETPPTQTLMPEARGMESERGLQPAFRKIAIKSVV